MTSTLACSVIFIKKAINIQYKPLQFSKTIEIVLTLKNQSIFISNSFTIPVKLFCFFTPSIRPFRMIYNQPKDIMFHREVTLQMITIPQGRRHLCGVLIIFPALPGSFGRDHSIWGGNVWKKKVRSQNLLF